MADQYKKYGSERPAVPEKGDKKPAAFQKKDDVKVRYGDILDCAYPFPLRHARMPVLDRAAQFASFAALNGYEEAVEEEARLTERKIDLDESVREAINQTLVEAEKKWMSGETIWLSVTWFQPDTRKEGGAYRTSDGRLKKMDHYRQVLWLTEVKEKRNEKELDGLCDCSIGFQQIAGIEILETGNRGNAGTVWE